MFVTRAKVASILPLYRDGEEALNIEVVRTSIAEFDLVVAKNRFVTNQTCLYIIPDVKIPDNGIFEEYIRPDGNASKSKLGKSGRLKAIKFNFSLDKDSDEKTFSQGIILSETDLPKWFYDKFGFETLDEFPEDFDWDSALEIVKYVAEDNSEGNVNGCPTRDFLPYAYKTDEPRIETKKWEGKKRVRLSRKFDGESTTSAIEPVLFRFCSRSKEKILGKMEKLNGLVEVETGNIFRIFFDKETMKRGFKNFETQEFVDKDSVIDEESNSVINSRFVGLFEEVKDSFITTIEKMSLSDNMRTFSDEKELYFLLRGEIIGSGHHKMKHNIDCVGESRIVFFGADEIILGHDQNPISVKRMENELSFLKEFCERFGYLYTVPIIEDDFTYDEVISFCKEFFKDEPREGIVVRGKNYSAKYINPDYDSKS